ncbi:MAG TPA: TM2 domain-containing protein [Pyrinomonadaceae bacterium]|jgi:TM2 domain-containing membrane protein YozV|nr:TM2 domain-containing protein [Pyrinomonadaceae bacterium]
MSRYCTKCGAVNDDTAQFCSNCQAPLTPVNTGYQPMQSVNQGAMTDWKAMGGDKKIVAGILAILVGSLGVHKFILGYTTEGLIMLLVTVLTCGIAGIVMSVVGIVEGIMYLTKSDEEFVRTYIQSKKGWF